MCRLMTDLRFRWHHWLGEFDRERYFKTEKDGYRLVYHDSLLNMVNWNWHEPHGTMRTLTEYRQENVLASGINQAARLLLLAYGDSYTGGMLCSRREFLYGYFEARVKAPHHHAWPALWLYTSPTGGAYHELDIMEFMPSKGGRMDIAQHRASGAGWDTVMQHVFPRISDWRDRWHTYGLEWRPGRLAWYCDGVCLYRKSHSVPDVPMILLLSVEGDPLRRTPEAPRQEMQISYVSTYEVAP